MENKELIQHFIEEIWNGRNFERLQEFLHSDFKDHSLPAGFQGNMIGLQNWVLATSASFKHRTHIEEQVTEKDKSVLKIRMNLKHIGKWREIEPTGLEVQTVGYRLFKMEEGKILEHWALIDGQSIENQLRQSFHGCKLPE